MTDHRRGRGRSPTPDRARSGWDRFNSQRRPSSSSRSDRLDRYDPHRSSSSSSDYRDRDSRWDRSRDSGRGRKSSREDHTKRKADHRDRSPPRHDSRSSRSDTRSPPPKRSFDSFGSRRDRSPAPRGRSRSPVRSRSPIRGRASSDASLSDDHRGYGMRGSTKKSTRESEQRRADKMNAPKKPPMSATGRAKPPVPGFSTAADNRAKVAALDTGGPSDVMVYYGGPPSPGGTLEGMAMQGPSIGRSSWPPSVKHVAQQLDQHFSQDASRTPAPHKDGVHFVEDAHYRRQSAGGFTDAMGGTPAAVGLNVQDMAFEESHDKLAKSFKPNQAREVQIGRVTAEGEHAGTLASKSRMMFLRRDSSQPYVEAHTVTQDGWRDMPDKDEIRAIKKEMGELSPSRPAASPSGFSISSTPKPRPVKYNAHTQNDSAASLYLSGTRSPGGTFRTGEEATEWFGDFYQNIRAGDPTPAATASQNFSGTGSYTPPFVVPPSPPAQPLTVPSFQFGGKPVKK